MMRRPLILWGLALSLAAIGFSTAAGQDHPRRAAKTVSPVAFEKGDPKAAAVPDAKPSAKGDTKPAVNVADKKSSNQPVAVDRSADEKAILMTGETFVKAYAAADTKAIGAHYTPDAEYIDEQGDVSQGREAIEEAIGACFAAHPGAQIEMDILSIRFISPGVAIEDGTTTVTANDDDAVPIVTRYTAVHVKTDGKWLTASVREQAPKDRRQHRTQLRQLSWLMGDWVDEGDDTLVIFSCKPDDSGNFLLREFRIHIAGQEAMRGTQRIGWDPATGKLKSWVFDSEGGYTEGFWHHDDNRWVLKSTGVTADGEPASSTTIYTLINADTMTWQSVDHEIAGVALPDSEVVTIARRAPEPVSADANVLSKSK